MGEVVEVEILGRADSGWSWRALHGQPHRGTEEIALEELRVGDCLVVDVQAHGPGWVIVRLVRWPPHAHRIIGRDQSEGDIEPEPIPPVQPGDILLRRVRFSRSDGEDRASKSRPCLVMEVTDHELRVRAIHGSNSFIRREGMGRRIRHWAEAGLSKPSIVSAEDIWIAADGARPVGRLDPRDGSRILS